MKHPSFRTMSIRSCAAGLLAVILIACGGGGTIPVTGVEIRPLSAEYINRKAVAYSPYRTAADRQGLATEVIPPANIKQDLDLLVAAGYGLIKVFDSSDKVARQTLQVIRDNNLNLRVQLGAYIGGDTYASASDKPIILAANQAEINRAVALATDPNFRDIILAVSVGNETQVDFSGVRTNVQTLVGYLRTVRSQITQPVTTDDNYAVWAGASTTLTDEVDFAAIHIYPLLDSVFVPNLWDWRQRGVPEAERGAAMMAAAMVENRRQYGLVRAHLDSKGLANMPVLVTETGWNAVDLGRVPFRGHPVNQKMYVDALNAWAAEGRADAGPKAVIYFEAFDEPWKQGDDGFGLFDARRRARYAIQPLGTCGVTWTCEPGAFTEADAVYFVPAVVNAAIAENKYTLFSEAAPGASELRPTGLRYDAFDGNSVNAPEVSDPAPGDGAKSIEITPQPKNYGWGFLNQSATVPPTSANLSGFAGGSVRLSIRTTYPGKIEIGISSDTQDRDPQEAYVQIGNGDFGYCNTGAWCQVTIPLSAFQAANPKLDLSLVLSRFIIADRYEKTGKPVNSNITTKLNIDAIYWSR
jgi:exo-beta-1,3-glucanase (GH17 family)